MIQALVATLFTGALLVSGLIGTQSLRDFFTYRDLNKSIATDLEQINSQHTTPSEEVKEPDFFSPAPTEKRPRPKSRSQTNPPVQSSARARSQQRSPSSSASAPSPTRAQTRPT